MLMFFSACSIAISKFRSNWFIHSGFSPKKDKRSPFKQIFVEFSRLLKNCLGFLSTQGANENVATMLKKLYFAKDYTLFLIF